MDKTDKKIHINFWYIIAAVLGMMLIQSLYLQSTKLTPIPYSRFQTLLNEDKVAEIGIAQNYISGSLKEAQPDGVKDFITTRVDPDLAQSLDKHGVVYSGVVENHWLRDLLSWILPAIFFVGIWMFAIRRMGQGGLGGLMQIGKSRAKVYVEKETKVTFADVAGVDEAKEELVEIVNFLKDPARLRAARRPPAEGRAAGRPARDRQDLARPRRCRRGRGAVLFDLRLGIRRDVRRRRRRAGARPVRAGAPACAGDHLHRRARCARPRPRAFRRGRPGREGADPEPAVGRARRLRPDERPGAARRDQPARDPRSGVAARRPVRPPGAGRPAGQEGARADPGRASEKGEARRAT